MPMFRFSTVTLSLVMALLALASITLIAPVFQGANKALQQEIKLAYERDQRSLSSLLEAQFKNIQQVSQTLSQAYEVQHALITANQADLSRAMKKLLSGTSGQAIDALMIEDRHGTDTVSTNVSLLNMQLPLADISRTFSPYAIWTSATTVWQEQQIHLLRLTLPIIHDRSGEVIGKLHTFVVLNDSYWIINQLQGLFGSQAISMHSADTPLNGIEGQPGQLDRLRAPKHFPDGVIHTDDSILREHALRIGASDTYRIRSLLPNSAQLALQSSYTTNLYAAIVSVVLLGIATILLLKHLISKALIQLTAYAEQVPESGSARPFHEGRFQEFVRVGKAIEKMLVRIREHDKNLSSIVDNSPDLIFIKDLENRYQLVNRRLADIVHHSPAQMVGGLDQDFWSDEQIVKVRQWDQQILNTQLPVQYEIKIQIADDLHTFLVSKFPILDDQGALYAIGGIATDITQEKESEELAWRKTNFDALTELPNRRMFIDRLEQYVHKAPNNGLTGAVLFIDLDHFKKVNNNLGHETGDLLIKETARRLQSCAVDINTLARLGGDEFAILLSEQHDMNSVEDIVQQLLTLLASPIQIANENIHISCSIGIAFFPHDAHSADTLIQCAGQARYQAKEQGRNRRSYFTPAIQESVQNKIFMANELRTALADNQLTVFYQPMIDLSNDAVYKAEALIRWQHPIRGFISPAEFIPVAEDSGIIIDVGNWVFRQAARQVKHWRDTLHPDFQISVNKSPAQFQQEDLCLYEWFDFLHQQSLPGQAIVVEMTEGLLMDSGPTVSSKLFALSDAGMEVALDDFGTGYSSLAYLKKYDIDYLKIDQSFVKNLEHDAEGAALCESIIMMAHRLGIKVIAEGVETRHQCEMLKAWGCDYAQGYLFSKPLPALSFERWHTDYMQTDYIQTKAPRDAVTPEDSI